MRVVIIKLRNGETIITKLLKEEDNMLYIEKPYLVVPNAIMPWLYMVQEGQAEQVAIRMEDLLLPPLPPKEQLVKVYLERISGLTIPTAPSPPPNLPPSRGGGVPPTRGGNLPPVQ